MRRVVLT
jgi:hypothetical protein